MIYFDNAATTFPKPPAVYERLVQVMKECGGNPGRGGHHFSVAASEVIEDTRRNVANLFGVADHRRVIFTHNCTDSINMVLKGLLRAGDHVVATNLDHNAVSRPLERIHKTLPIMITRVPFEASGRLKPETVQKAIRANTKLVVLTHGSNVLGCVQPLAPFIEMAKERNLALLVDAAQTAGRIRINAGDAPLFVACSGHKNLYGFPGTGILTVPEGFSLQSWREGGTGTASEALEHPDELPMRLEAGTPNTPGIASVQLGIDFIQREGMQKIHEKELQLVHRLEQLVRGDERFVVYSAAEDSERLAILAFNFRRVSTEEAAAILDASFGIAVRGGLHCAAVLHAQLGTIPGGCLRVSPGYFNTDDDIDQLTDALKSIVDKY